MRTLNYTSDDGLIIDNNSKSLTLLIDLDALVNKTKRRLKFFLNEWLLDITAGVPYFQQIFEKPVDASLIVSILVNEMQKQSEIISVRSQSIDLNRELRTFSYSAKIESIYGNAEITTTG